MVTAIDEDELLKTRLEAERQQFLAMAPHQQERYMESARRVLRLSLCDDQKTVLFTAIQLMLNDEYAVQKGMTS